MAMNWGGAGSGALSGAALGTAVMPGIGTAVGALGGGLLGAFSGGKKKAPTFNSKPYSGYKPPRIDSPGQEILRPAQKQDFDITMNRSLGNDVGYDPSWMTSASALTKSSLDSALSDRLRNQSGSLSASGLSGNPRAYEATAGRSQRDYSSDLENSMNRLNVANMEASRADKNSATQRLADLNRFNFGQENTAANFDKSVWGAEQGYGFDATSMDNENYWKNLEDEQASSEGNMGFATDIAQGLSPSIQAMLSSGKGLAPNQVGTTYNGQPATGYRKDVNNKYLIK